MATISQETRRAVTNVEYNDVLYRVHLEADFNVLSYREPRPYSDSHTHETFTEATRTNAPEITGVSPYLEDWSVLEPLINVEDEDFR